MEKLINRFRATIRSRWYRLAANQLLLAIDKLNRDVDEKSIIIFDQQDHISRLKMKISSLEIDVLTEKERANLHNSDAAIAVQVIRERMRGGEMLGVLSARERATKVRIRELELEVDSLRNRLREAL